MARKTCSKYHFKFGVVKKEDFRKNKNLIHIQIWTWHSKWAEICLFLFFWVREFTSFSIAV
jgi:hypothetical protein